MQFVIDAINLLIKLESIALFNKIDFKIDFNKNDISCSLNNILSLKRIINFLSIAMYRLLLQITVSTAYRDRTTYIFINIYIL